jgi:hypothetical protein
VFIRGEVFGLRFANSVQCDPEVTYAGNVTLLVDTKQGSKVFERFAVLLTARTMNKP